ncbi:MAG TPA: DUF1573 domain-containing protein [Pirellulales bacterium]|nr:DUF1573 domain-containing protein [Pirellulales bacterium]
MLRIVMLILALVSATGSSALGQEWARKMFETTSHDFGLVARGAKAEFRFKLTNIYLEDVHISGVRSSCGCTTPTIGTELLKTYDEGYVLATFNTRNHLGQKSATLTVTLDKPFPAEVQLQVAGFIRSDVELEPGGIQFGTLDAGTAAEKLLKITARTGRDWQITEIRSSSEFVEAEAVETGRQVGQVTYDMKVRLLPGAPTGYLKERLVVVANDSKSTEFSVEIEGRILSALTVNPPQLFMGTLKPGSTSKKRIVIQARQKFSITGIECDRDGFEFQVPETAATVHQIPVVYQAGDKPGKITGKIRILTDLGGTTTAELPAQLVIVEPEDADRAGE